MKEVQILFKILLIWDLILTILVGLLGWTLCNEPTYQLEELELIKTPVPELVEVKINGNSYSI